MFSDWVVEEFMFIFLLDFTVGQSTDEKEAASASLCIIVVKAFSPSCGAWKKGQNNTVENVVLQKFKNSIPLERKLTFEITMS